MTTMNTSFRPGQHPALSADVSIEHLEQWADRVIASHRNDFDQPEAGLLPSSETIESLGGDSIAIATLLDKGILSGAALGKAYNDGLCLREFSLAIKDGGLDVAIFAQALANGLSPEVFSRALECGMEPDGFAALFQTYGAKALNGCLENFCDSVEREQQYPDPEARAWASCVDREVELLGV